MAVSNLVAAVCLLGYASLAGMSLLDLPTTRLPEAGSLLDIRSATGAWALARDLLTWLAVRLLYYAPLGVFAVFTMPDCEGRLARGLRVALPALVIALLSTPAILAARADWTAPGPFELVLPSVGIPLGVWAGLAWRRGWWSRLVFLPKLAALGVAPVVVGLALALLALEKEPAVPEKPAVSSADRRHLVSLFRGKNPRKVPPGQTRTLRLSAQELDQLVAWAASVGLHSRSVLRLQPGGVSGVAAVRVPRTGRWLNVAASTQVAIEKGRLSVAEPRLEVGDLALPPRLLDILTPLAVAGLQGDRDLRRVLPAVELLALDAEKAVLVYGHADMPPGLIARLVWGEETSGVMRDAVAAQIDGLLEVLPAAPKGDARFGTALETAFALARRRSKEGGAVEANRAALLALGIVLGHPRLARTAGEPLDEERQDLAVRLRRGTTVRGRADWVRHFTVSGALTVLSSVAPSDAAGLLKEELDADGGSGFSFGDLLADRAGTTLAEVATRDEASAAATQTRLARGFRVDDFFPSAHGLPESIPDRELQSRYGGVGGRLYRRIAEDVERRVSACAAYRD